ncbi:MAG TPA: DUF1365 family protein, partial [Pseudonocardiaceae bacterium]
AKDLYVSPFLGPHGEYVMRVPEPSASLSVTVALRQDGRTTLAATVRGTRKSAGTWSLVRMLARRPFMPQRVSALIRGHGIALWLRGVPIARRVPHVHQEGVR